MTALIGKPGGGAVFDALVADLPDATTDTKTMTTAIEARFGTQVHQFNHREKGMDGAKDDAVYTDARKETNPDAPQKGLKDLYRVLRMVPQKGRELHRVDRGLRGRSATAPSSNAAARFRRRTRAGRPTGS